MGKQMTKVETEVCVPKTDVEMLTVLINISQELYPKKSVGVQFSKVEEFIENLRDSSDLSKNRFYKSFIKKFPLMHYDKLDDDDEEELQELRYDRNTTLQKCETLREIIRRKHQPTKYEVEEQERRKKELEEDEKMENQEEFFRDFVKTQASTLSNGRIIVNGSSLRNIIFKDGEWFGEVRITVSDENLQEYINESATKQAEIKKAKKPKKSSMNKARIEGTK